MESKKREVEEVDKQCGMNSTLTRAEKERNGKGTRASYTNTDGFLSKRLPANIELSVFNWASMGLPGYQTLAQY